MTQEDGKASVYDYLLLAGNQTTFLPHTAGKARKSFLKYIGMTVIDSEVKVCGLMLNSQCRLIT